MDATISGLFVYPVKSCGGIRVEKSVLEPRGFRHDRRWMVVDETKTFVTQRTAPRLALITTTLDAEALVLEAPGLPVLRVPVMDAAFAPSPGALVSVRVWRDDVLAVDCGERPSSWLTRWLGAPASLVFMPDASRRPVHPAYATEGDIVSFADGFPLLIASTSSLEDLNAQMPKGVPMDRFRPNIVVSGAPPWSEDSWARVLIGPIPLRLPKPCERCVVTTVDQRTGEGGIEPMRTLALRRKRGNGVLFAQNAVAEATGTIAMGDAVTVVRRADAPPFE
ncbi:MAG: MOSC N-terminal beta barrel domain-containing protein [Myxococcota bacterium]|nr:MOSC N-terminal beta barrel domain-containing protein [Myxococcota bacterium]